MHPRQNPAGRDFAAEEAELARVDEFSPGYERAMELLLGHGPHR